MRVGGDPLSERSFRSNVQKENGTYQQQHRRFWPAASLAAAGLQAA
jgi:hypothetical protein